MKFAIIIILASWFLNAVMDAIDHGKGDQTLYELWHILKALSYWLPFGYIMYLSRMPVGLIVITVFLMGIWEIIYHFLRNVEFWRLDNKIKIPFLRWLWGIKR